MTRDPLLPARLVDGVWISADPAVASPIADDPFTPTPPRTDADPFPPTWRPFPCFPDPVVFADVVLPPRPVTDYARAFAEYNPPTSREVTIPITVNADDWRKFTAPRVAPSFGYNPATGETVVSFDAEATCPGEAPIPVRAVVTWPTPAPKATGSVDYSPTLSGGEPRFWAAITDEQRTIFAAVALDGSGVWAIGDTEQEARANAVDRRDNLRDQARSVDDDFPDASTDAAWLDTLALVTLSGTTGSLRAIVKALDDVIPWCPADLWDNPEPVKEP